MSLAYGLATSSPSREAAPARTMSTLADRNLGNQAVLRRLQRKLTVGATNDPLEHEADAVAEHVLRMPDAAPALSAAPQGLSRKCAACEDEDREVMRAPTSADSASVGGSEAPAAVQAALDRSGRPLDRETRAFFEPRFGVDFGHVRVHDDALAGESARAVGASAYAVGGDIVFGAGRHRPGDPEGRRLIAHELAHVVQQSNGALRRAPDDAPDLGPQPAEPMGPKKADVPNKAPGCDEVCGEVNKCTREADQACTDAQDKTVKTAFQTGAANVASAIDHMTNTPDSPELAKALLDHFKWSKGGAPVDLPARVLANLNTALGKFADNLCNKCLMTCDPGGVAQVVRARGQNCLGSNCYNICPAFTKDNGPHALTHELFHRVVGTPAGDIYRGQAGYPADPPLALKMPDAYASLVDDLAAAAAAAAAKKQPAPVPKP